jgi:ribonuclease HI
LYGFAEPLGVTTAYVAEMCGAMRAIEIAFQNNWTHLWIESDSSYVVSAFKNPEKQVSCFHSQSKEFHGYSHI